MSRSLVPGRNVAKQSNVPEPGPFRITSLVFSLLFSYSRRISSSRYLCQFYVSRSGGELEIGVQSPRAPETRFIRALLRGSRSCRWTHSQRGADNPDYSPSSWGCSPSSMSRSQRSLLSSSLRRSLRRRPWLSTALERGASPSPERLVTSSATFRTVPFRGRGLKTERAPFSWPRVLRLEIAASEPPPRRWFRIERSC